jgi:hypothetical protein
MSIASARIVFTHSASSLEEERPGPAELPAGGLVFRAVDFDLDAGERNAFPDRVRVLMIGSLDF